MYCFSKTHSFISVGDKLENAVSSVWGTTLKMCSFISVGDNFENVQFHQRGG